MQKLGGILLRATFVVAALVTAGVLWRGAVEGWIRQELLALAASQLEPSLEIEGARYRFPGTVTLEGVRLTHRAVTAGEATEILAVESATLELEGIPMPDAPFRVERIRLSQPRLRLLPGEAGFLGFEGLLRETPGAARAPGSPRGGPGEYFGTLAVDVHEGRAERLAADGSPAWQVDGIEAGLRFRSTGDAVDVAVSIERPDDLESLARENDVAGRISALLSRPAR